MALKSAWTTAPLGRMAPIEQAKLWAVRAVLADQGEVADQYQRMSRFVVKVGGGHPDRHTGFAPRKLIHLRQEYLAGSC